MRDCRILDLQVFRGDTFRRHLRFQVDGESIDISDWTFSGQVRTLPNAAGSLVADFTFDFGVLPIGEVEFSIDAADTLTLPTGFLFYDCQAVTGAGDVVTFMRGRFSVLEDVTRP